MVYELIPGVYENDICLVPTKAIFWVGVQEGICPSPPIDRNKTKCYIPANVYLYLNTEVFSMMQKNDAGEFYKVFYKIPENELMFLQLQ